ncbi:glycoside hydrolase family 2 TIM barrel-domain containing protein [Robinsoniella peoriensis]
MKKIRMHNKWLFWKEGHEDSQQEVMIPHDAMFIEKRDPNIENGSNSGYFPGGQYYYETKLFGEKELANQSVILEFEGVYMDSTVYLNGEQVGGWIYGYTNFFVDITNKLHIGQENILLVKVENTKTPNSRWYSGSGIYRMVNMWVGNPCHITPQGLKVKTVTIHPATIQVHTEIECLTEDVEIEYSIFRKEKEICHAKGNNVEIQIPNAELWNADHPNLYYIKAKITKNGQIIDRAETNFGIRIITWNAQEGLMINGISEKLRGGCIHHDHGILGACTYDQAEYRRVRKLKEFGFNAIRYSHYPAGKNLLEVCDELGMYVLDETFDQWKIANTKYDYAIYFDAEWKKDIAALAAKDYNHPSVIMYSIGNEISDIGRNYGTELSGEMYEFLHKLDDTRPITIATNVDLSLMSYLKEKDGLTDGTIGSIEINDMFIDMPRVRRTFTPELVENIVGESFDVVDIAGYNYGHVYFDDAKKMKPDRIILSSETLPSSMASNWKAVMENKNCIGDFHWTAWDYLGETGVGLPIYGTDDAAFSKPYPCLTAACGSFDLIGNPEPAAYYAAILWDSYLQPYIAVRPVNHSGEKYSIGGWRLTDAVHSWTWEDCEERTAEITVYSIGETVELWLNQTLIGSKKLIDRKAEFETSYEKGTLEAVSYDKNGRELGRDILRTAKKEVVITIQPEELEVEAEFNRIIYIPISLTDTDGVLNMQAEKKITLEVTGAGKLLALGSARPDPVEHFCYNSCKSWNGQLLAIVQCHGEIGKIYLKASADGCKSVKAEIVVVEKYDGIQEAN